jgi:S-adenosylmethionine:tRNA ribosyltransferase-isomerase
MEEYGNMPLPPYVDHDKSEDDQKQLYQTEFAQEDGSVAAPTASLRFTREVLDTLDKR